MNELDLVTLWFILKLPYALLLRILLNKVTFVYPFLLTMKLASSYIILV